ncbi:hypothetical protein [Actinomycetospora sp. TBRC 11914]|uniref:hypothetical protein n=1 Tax=Actinomycetospora sp. TBRC 11914 TaxID=2729387 RepID=UPI00145E5138|nr:hypothetical protein [Actinomycetospora sp. TBRC 11914]NMO88906.1 hypothetical protein [Actinomycetospora sp. TBRC 11914]
MSTVGDAEATGEHTPNGSTNAAAATTTSHHRGHQPRPAVVVATVALASRATLPPRKLVPPSPTASLRHSDG